MMNYLASNRKQDQDGGEREMCATLRVFYGFYSAGTRRIVCHSTPTVV